MPKAKVTSKGQITIPVAVRRALGIETGDTVDFYEAAPGQWSFRARTGSIMDLAGIVQKMGYVPEGPAPTIEQMDEAIEKAAAEEYLRSIDRTPADAKTEAAA